MQYCEINFQTILLAIKHHWKLIIASTVCFAILGGIGGVIYIQRGNTPAQGSAQALEPVKESPDLTEEKAYSDFQSELELAYKNINSYYSAFQTSEFLTEDEQKEISAALEELGQLHTSLIQTSRAQMGRYGAIYVPTAFLPKLTSDYEAQLANIESSLIAVNEAVATVRSMGAPTFEQETITNTYASLLSQAADYGALLQSQAKIQFILERLTTEQDEIIRQCQQLRTMQQEAASALNEQITTLNSLVSRHAADNHLNFLVTYDVNREATITLNHTHRAATVQEDFVLVFLFCTMTGLCVGGYYAVCLEGGACIFPKKKKHS